jgi:hypothetical protein
VAPAAVILPSPEASVYATVHALENQSRAPERILLVESGSKLAAALREASQRASSWLWLLDAGVIPEPDALAELLELATGDGAASPALVVSKVLAPDGSLDPGSLPVPEVHRGERVLAALERKAVPLRVARRGSMLVRHDAVRQLEPRQLLDYDLEWTAGVLREQPGWLAPASVAVRQESRRRSRRRELVHILRLLRALERDEWLWFAAHFAEQAWRRP